MGYGSVLLVVGSILLLGFLFLSMNSAMSDADAEVNEYQFNELARDAATTGLQLTVRKLAASAAGGSWKNGAAFSFATTSFGSGSFRSEVVSHDPNFGLTGGASSGDTVDVTVRGVNGDGRAVIFARYAREYADGGIPPAFRNVITSDFYMQLGGNMSIRSIRADQNASIHTNEDLNVLGNSFLVEGYGTYSGDSYVSDQQLDNFQPNVDTNGPDSNVFWQPPIDIKQINIANLSHLAQNESGTYISTANGLALAIDGNNLPVPNVLDFRNPSTFPWDTDVYSYNCASPPCGTADSPFILVVKQNLALSGRIEVRGYGVIVSEGNVSIEGGNGGSSGGGIFGELTSDKKETKLMVASMNTLTLNGNSCLGLGPKNGSENNHCQSTNGEFTHGVTLYAEDQITFRGTPYIVGGIVAKNSTYDDVGNPTVYWGSPTEEITDPGFEFITPIGPILIAYSEF